MGQCTSGHAPLKRGLVSEKLPNAAYQPRRTLWAVGCMRLFGGLPAGMTNRCSGSNLHGGVKVDLSRCPAGHYSSLAWTRGTNAISPHSAEMELNRPLDAPEGRVDRLPGGDTSRQIRNGGAPIAIGVFVDAHEVP